tara:strand:+ start:521 stop:676 length:156 start_codon:yes stop_codon:yes gene_type:complete
MKIDAISVDDYFDKIPGERKEVINKIRAIINTNLTNGFEDWVNKYENVSKS